MLFIPATQTHITVKVTPGSREDAYIETLPDGTIKIRLRAKAVDGKANDALLDFLRQETGAKWEIITGFTHVRKTLRKK